MSNTDPANPSDEIAVFQTYIALINSERETIWARHNALLVANSLIIGALAISPTALWENKWAALAMLAAGLLVSFAWLIITIQGWAVMRRHEDLVGSFAASFHAPAQSVRRPHGQPGPSLDLPADPAGGRRFRADVSRTWLCPPQFVSGRGT